MRQQLLQHELVAAQLALQVGRLVVLGFDAVGPHARDLCQKAGRGAGHVGVVGATEAGFGVSQAVAVQQFTLVAFQQVFQRGLPPGELQLGRDNFGRYLTGVQVIQQLGQAAFVKLLLERVTFGQGHEQDAVVHEGVQAGVQNVQVGAHKVGAVDCIGKHDTQARQLGHQGVQGVGQLIQVLRNLRGAGCLDMANPLGTFGLHNLELFVQIPDVHAGQDVLLRRATQAGALHTAHLDAVLATPRTGGGCGNQIGHGAVVHIGAETLKRLANAHQDRQLRLPLGNRAARAQAQHGGHTVHGLAQIQQGGLQGNDQGVGLRGLLVIDQAGAVPRRGARGRGESVNLAQAHELGAHLIAFQEGVQHGAVEAHAGGRAVLGCGQLGQTLQGGVHRNLPVWVLREQSAGVVDEGLAGGAQFLVEVLGVRLLGTFVAYDGADKFGSLRLRIVFGQQVVAQAVDAGALEQGRELGERRTLLAHHEHGFAAADEGGGNIHGGAQRLGAGGRGHSEGETAHRGVDNVLGVCVRVEQEHLLGGVALVQGLLQVVGVQLARLHAGHLQRRHVTHERGDGGVGQLAQAFLQVGKG